MRAKQAKGAGDRAEVRVGAAAVPGRPERVLQEWWGQGWSFLWSLSLGPVPPGLVGAAEDTRSSSPRSTGPWAWDPMRVAARQLTWPREGRGRAPAAHRSQESREEGSPACPSQPGHRGVRRAWFRPRGHQGQGR